MQVLSFFFYLLITQKQSHVTSPYISSAYGLRIDGE